MTKNEIINDVYFKRECNKYGLDHQNCEIYDEAILLNTPLQDLYVIFDKNYNTIAVEKFNSTDSKESKIDFARRKVFEYSNFNDNVLCGERFGYPFENLTLKQIIDLSHRIEIMACNHGHSFTRIINGEWYDWSSKKDKVYFNLLSYIKFLGEEIKKYFLINYQFQVLCFEAPNIYEYVRTLINQINNSINFYLEHNKRPLPTDILSSLGQDRQLAFDDVMEKILNDITELIMNDKGYKMKNYYEIEKNTKAKSKTSLSVFATRLLKILELSDEDLKQKEENISKGLVEKNVSELHQWLEEDNPQKEGFAFVKKLTNKIKK